LTPAGESWINLTQAEDVITHCRTVTALSIAFACILLGLVSPRANADSHLLDEWFRESEHASRYEDQRDDFRRLLEQARTDGVPPELMMLVLREGAAKRVSPSRLVAAMEEEGERLATSRTLLEEADLLPIRNADIRDALRELSVYQVAGVEPDSIRAILDATESLEVGLQAVSAVAQIVAIQPLSEPTTAELGRSILTSDLTPATFGSVSSAYLRGTLAGLPPQSVARIIIDVLDAGGGLIQIDRELRARGRRR
jgi:hypothetical protein